MTTHEQIARDIAGSIATAQAPVICATATARQGDLLLRRVCHDAGVEPVDRASVLLAAGRHGEHWVVGQVARRDDVLLVGHAGGVVVHTDIPAARHASIALAPGEWAIGVQRELGLGQVVRQVVD